MGNRKTYRGMLLCCFVLAWACCPGQVPFKRTGQVFLTTQFPDAVTQLDVTSGGSTPQLNSIGNGPTGGLEAIGFRKTDNLLYGISRANKHLYRADATGNLEDLGALPLDNSLNYFAGDVHPSGQYLYSIGSLPDDKDILLARTDLNASGFPTSMVALSSFSKMVDIAFDPYTNVLYGYDKSSRQFVTINPGNGSLTALGQIGSTNEIEALFFDAFGDLYAYGRAVFGTVAGFFIINKNTGKEKLLATGPIYEVLDGASCPFSVEMKNDVEPEETLPCTDLTYTYTIANGSGETFTGVDFEHTLPLGFHLAAVSQNPFGVPVDTLNQPGAIRLGDFVLTTGINKLIFKIAVNNIPDGQYKSQAFLKNLPTLYGLECLSDNPATGGFEDSTGVKVKSIDGDSLSHYLFVCHGESIELDASAFGNNIIWNTGATTHLLEVSKGGIYTVGIVTRCQSLEVMYDVTSASCPFTISLSHDFVPDTIFPCSDVIFRYIFNNNSGEERRLVSFRDSLPSGFTFISIIDGPPGGVLKPGLPLDVVCVENMTLPKGRDTLDLLVHAGNVPPGNHFNQAIIYNLPQVLGPIRFSDYLPTLPADASPLLVLGTWSDTLFFDTMYCANSELKLDASHLGQNFLWEDGSTASTFVVKNTGTYHLTLFDGCEPADVFWDVGEGPRIEINLPIADSIHQGEQIALNPVVLNQGSILSLNWTDSLENTLSCINCLRPFAMPLKSAVYTLVASNEICSDTALIKIFVDVSRRVFAPTAFSPNHDGINDFFFLQSPDFGLIHKFVIFDRWGASVFSSGNSVFNDEKTGWDGTTQGKNAAAGVYAWRAEVEFIDGEKSVYFGTFSIVR